jgi:hypothetical protein
LSLLAIAFRRRLIASRLRIAVLLLLALRCLLALSVILILFRLRGLLSLTVALAALIVLSTRTFFALLRCPALALLLSLIAAGVGVLLFVFGVVRSGLSLALAGPPAFQGICTRRCRK